MKYIQVSSSYPFDIYRCNYRTGFEYYFQAEMFQCSEFITHYNNKLNSCSKKDRPKYRRKIKKFKNKIDKIKVENCEFFL